MTTTVKLEARVSAKGRDISDQMKILFREKGIFCINIIGSPGAGKTALLEALAPRLQGRAAVIEGDLLTDQDKQRIEAAGLPAYEINTMGACHLDAAMVRDALDQLPLDQINLLVIENVGNLVCPSSFEVGEDLKLAVVSVTEGADKPAKYPTAMMAASALVITKLDLLPYVDCDVERMERDAMEVNPKLTIFRCCARTGEGLAELLGWLDEQARQRA